MSSMAIPGAWPTERPIERERPTGVLATLFLGSLCGLPAGESAASCGKVWCNYFDENSGRCGLLALDIPGRLGPDALRWLVAHRTTRRLAESPNADALLGARATTL